VEIFRVPKREVPVRIVMDDGRRLDGRFWVPEVGPDGDQGRVRDRLNDDEEGFVPLACGEDRLLLNKSGIVTVELDRQLEHLAGGDDAVAREVAVRITLVGGNSLVGRLRLRMPPERARVLDYLNAAPRFVPLLGEDKITLVHRSYVLFVRTLDEEAG
jgi:hypothetical protein